MRFSIVLMLLPLAFATPLPQSGNVECGSDDYTDAEIADAATAACNYLSEGSTAGGSKYPEKYNDYEGFTFGGVEGPYYEFPIMADGSVYDGGRMTYAWRNDLFTHSIL
jgi:ribonuclease